MIKYILQKSHNERGFVMDKTKKGTTEKICSDYRKQITQIVQNINTVDYLIKIYSFAKVFLEE